MTLKQTDARINDLDIKVGQLESEVRFQETLLARTEIIISDVAGLSNELKSRQAVQDERITQMLENLKHNHEDIEALRRENIKQFTQLQTQIRSFDKWKWYLVGAVTVLSVMSHQIDLLNLFR
jgi:D-ribose pyranose/furanose isomerase RbsD